MTKKFFASIVAERAAQNELVRRERALRNFADDRREIRDELFDQRLKRRDVLERHIADHRLRELRALERVNALDELLHERAHRVGAHGIEIERADGCVVVGSDARHLDHAGLVELDVETRFDRSLDAELHERVRAVGDDFRDAVPLDALRLHLHFFGDPTRHLRRHDFDLRRDALETNDVGKNISFGHAERERPLDAKARAAG